MLSKQHCKDFTAILLLSSQFESVSQLFKYSPTQTLVEFHFGCKFMFVTGKIEFYAAPIILGAHEFPSA
jgi:hypothetical protein